MSDLQVDGGHANVESLHEDSFLVQAMSLQRELGSPRTGMGQGQHPVIYNHAALPQKQRKTRQSGKRHRESSHPQRQQFTTESIPEESFEERRSGGQKLCGDGLRASYLEDANQADKFVKNTTKGSSKGSKALKKKSSKEELDKDERIEAARFDFFMFKQTMYDLLDEVKGNHSRVGPAQTNQITLDQTLSDKLTDVESKLEKLDVHFEYLASTAERSEKLNQANITQKKQKKELAKSLKEIEFTY